MSRILDQRILLLVISFLTSLQSTKVLSEWKKCGDRECETAMSRVQATTDYLGPDCRYLNFKTGEEIMVYSKLSRKNEDLWTGSKGKDFGYFPKDAVKVEEVFIAEEVEVLTKETDFLCLHGDKYAFESEDSALHDHNKENEYSSSDAESKLHENELLKHTRDSMQKEERVESVSENDSKEFHTQEESASKKLVRKNEDRKDDTEEQQMQTSPPLEPIPTQSSWIAGWFTVGSKNDEEPLKAITESLEENTYRGRKIVVTAENDLQEPNDKEEQAPPASVWFQGGLTDFLYFSEENVDVALAADKNDPQIHGVSGVPGHSNNEQETAATELWTEEEKSESQESPSNWFNLGLSNVLNFGHAEKDTIAMEDQQSTEREDEANKNEEVQTLSMCDSLWSKEPKEMVKAVTGEEDEENYAEEIIDSNSNMSNPGEIPASVHTVNDTKSTSNSTESSFDILTGDKEKRIEPYSSEQDLVSESQLLKNTEAKKRNQESESKHGQSESVNSENELPSYGELQGTADNHLGMKKTPCDSEQNLTLETSEKGKPVKCCDTEQNSASKSRFKMNGDAKDKIHKPENKTNPLGFYENNIKDFSQDIFNDEQDHKSEESQELTPDQPFSPHPSSSDFSLTGVGSRRRLLEETPEKEHEMNAPVDSERDSDQHSKVTAIPSVNSEEKMDSSVVDSPFDVKKPFSDAIQNYVPSN
ncbi:PREDICTED: melanoma inhibitory activity protein 2, partial [Cariama cristata]|uniref:melanoma inhibitory activity protein 2 n=1 Tax=Cariama cristata TaxID=54380 RepID=UPI000520E0C2